MSHPTLVHHLTKVDRERQTAVCSLCGPTEVYIAKGSKPGTTRAYCRNRIRESRKVQSQRLQDLKRSQNPNWKPRHCLSKIDAKNMKAICSVCGLTEIRKKVVHKNTFYICNTKKREYKRRYWLSHFKAPPLKPKN